MAKSSVPSSTPFTQSADASSAAPAPAQPASYEAALQELEGLTNRLESGQLPLDQLLAGYQRGAQLLRGEVGGHVCTSHFHLLPPATEARTAQRGTNAPCTKTQARTASKGRPAAKAVVPLEGEGAKRLRGCLIFLGVASWQC